MRLSAMPVLVLLSTVLFAACEDPNQVDGESDETALTSPSAVDMAPAPGPLTTSFASFYTNTLRGNLMNIGNASDECDSTRSGQNCTTINADANLTSGNNNDGIYTQNADYDDATPGAPASAWTGGSSDTYNSTAATLTIPPGATVVYAALHWNGQLSNSGGVRPATGVRTFSSVLFAGPGDAAYTSQTTDQFYSPACTPATSSACDVSTAGFNAGIRYYLNFKDVTAFVQARGSGTYWVANVPFNTGNDDGTGGWKLSVVYSDGAEEFRNIQLYHGMVSYGTANIAVPLTGFITPALGPIDATATYWAQDGDRYAGGSNKGDTIGFNGSAAANQLSNAVNPAADYGNSTISTLGSFVTARTPAHKNTLGQDLDSYAVGSRLANGATSATMNFVAFASNEVNRALFVSFATTVQAPDVTATKSARVLDPSGADDADQIAEPGDTIVYTITVRDNDRDNATNVVVTDEIPAGTSYVAGSLQIDGSALGALTDAVDTDRAEKLNTPAPRGKIVARIGTGANGTTGGTIAVGTQRTVAFRVLVGTPVLGQAIENAASVTFNGATIGSSISLAVNTADNGGPTSTGVCQNGLVEAPEQCDDGNNVTGDGCAPDCTLQAISTCGNNTVEPTEECDDGGLVDGDGCSSTCTIEPGFTCRGAPTVINDDCDNDGLTNLTEDANGDSVVNPGETNPYDADSDDDGLSDGDEVLGAGPLAAYAPTNPLNRDTDGDGLQDGTEVGVSVRLPDTGPGWILDASPTTKTDPNDNDSDDDGLSDGAEDVNRNGATSATETDPNKVDTDLDLIQDGTERGVTTGVSGTNPAVFIPDADPTTTTLPRDNDTDNDGLKDGQEDRDHDGKWDGNQTGLCRDETDPNVVDTDAQGGSDQAEGGTGCTAPDTDGDGRIEAIDVCIGEDSSGDTDRDGVCNNRDQCLGSNDALDADGDGVPDGCDVCAGFDDRVDPDGDGVPTGCDICLAGDDRLDADGDGIPNACDTCTGATTDTDGDGVPDACDICPGSNDTLDADGDGVPNGCDVCPGFNDALDADGDGVPNGCDVCPGSPDSVDADGDGVPDGCDVCPGYDDLIDVDLDTVPDGCDNCPTDANANQADADQDSVGDACDVCPGFEDTADADLDGVPDGCDVCEGYDDALDADADGVPDGCDVCATGNDTLDTDGDGVPNACDECAGFNDNVDTDRDGVPDGCDVCAGFNDNLDADFDTVPDGCDTCPNGSDTLDADLDGTPDGCDLCPGFDDAVDTDGDGVPDGCDICNAGPDSADGDNDGVPDACDVCPGSNDALDADRDGVPNGCDVCPGANDNLDSDLDGVPNGCDVCAGYDDNLDGDNDGVPDGCDVCSGFDDTVDADFDTVPDGCDVCPGSNDTLDADNDGVPDGCDVCVGFDDKLDSDGDGIPNGCDTCGGITTDTDGDGVPDDCDLCPGFDDALDADADGVPDGCDICAAGDDTVDSDGDGVPDACDVCAGFDDALDADGDGVPDGCDTCTGATTDTDGDGVADGCDTCPGFDDALDADADGVADGCDTCPGFDDTADTDLDGVADGCDACDGFDDNVDTDFDGVADGCDVCAGFDDFQDADADLVPDGCDVCPGFDDSQDSDADGIPNGCDTCVGDTVDTDGDTVPDACDICVGFDDAADADFDTVPDGCDVCAGSDDLIDTDADGVPDGCDVCAGFDDLLDADADTVPDGCDVCAGGDDTIDLDENGVPDDCDVPCSGGLGIPDTDGDGICDTDDLCWGDDVTGDPDGDGLCNDTEEDLGSDPEDADSDDDGLSDGTEFFGDGPLTDYGATDPTNPDTDGDGLQDGTETGVTVGTEDTDPAVFVPDTDPTTTTNPKDPDTDHGGVPDGDEDLNGNGFIDPGEINPNDPSDDCQFLDNDGDGLTNAEEDVNCDGVVDPGETDPNNPDTDDDGLNDGEEVHDTLTDPLDPDTDDDGLSDGDEVHDYGTDPLDQNTDDDSFNDGFEVTWDLDPLVPDVTQGSGCDQTGASPSALLALLAGLVGMSRRRSRGAVAVAALAASGTAAAQDAAIDAQRFDPIAQRPGFSVVRDAEMMAPGSFTGSLSINYAANPFELGSVDTHKRTAGIVDNLFGFDAGFGYAPLKWLHVGLDLPILDIQANSERSKAIGGVLGGSGKSAGLGDLRLQVAFAPLRQGQNAPISLQVVPRFIFPTGAKHEFVGSGAVGLGGDVAVAWRTDHFRLAANVGYMYLTKTTAVGQVKPDDELNWGLAGAVPFGEDDQFEVELEWAGGAVVAPKELATVGGKVFDSVHTPTELLAGFVYLPPTLPLWVKAGMGPGLTHGFGTPDVRVFATVGGWLKGKVPPPDTDGDGFTDDVDQCPTVPEDVDGFEDTDGCADVDNDADRVLDVDDKCPMDPEDRDAFQDEDGCPDRDDDADGILDVDDGCRLEPEDKDGFQDEDGCPDLDNDKDRILDAVDKCPLEPEVINGVDDADGCPDESLAQVNVETKEIVILDKIYFDYDKDKVSKKSLPVIQAVAEILKAYPEIEQIEIGGHTDSRGRDEYNLDLSTRRVQQVRAALIKMGIGADRLVAHGYGETMPIVAAPVTEEDYARNRRVEFKIVKQAEGAPEVKDAGANQP